MKDEQYDKIYIMGDLHGEYHSLDVLCNKIPDNSLIIQVGDWGIGFEPRYMRSKLLEYIQESLERIGSKIYVIRGNHDDPSQFPQVIGNIHFLEDYTYKTINGMKFLFVGGATSIDRFRRSENRDWWRDEGLKYDPNKCKEECDVLIIHSAAKSWFPHDTPDSLRETISYFVPDIGTLREEMHNDLTVERQKLEQIFIQTKPKFSFYGHFHTSHKEVIEGCVTKLLHINEYVEFDGKLSFTHDLIDNN